MEYGDVSSVFLPNKYKRESKSLKGSAMMGAFFVDVLTRMAEVQVLYFFANVVCYCLPCLIGV